MAFLDTLITLQDIREANVYPLPNEIADDRINVFIGQGQNITFVEAVGMPFFIKLREAVLDTNDPYHEPFNFLWLGGEYTRAGQYKEYAPGLKVAMCYYAVYNIIEGNKFNLTRYGATYKTNIGESEPVPDAVVTRHADSYKDRGNWILVKTAEYYHYNRGLFPGNPSLLEKTRSSFSFHNGNSYNKIGHYY